MTRVRGLLILLTAAFALAVPVAPTAASVTQEASFQDNSLLLVNQSHLDRTLQTLKLLGVQRLRITVVWTLIAPSPNSRRRPHFDATDPAAYPAAGWAPYDTLAREAPKFGMGVNFDLTGAAPLWATPPGAPPHLQHVWYPSASEFGAFVKAIGIRYSGTYRPAGASGPLPRVKYWSIWNEPNVGSSSLSPQAVNGVEVGPRLYRGLLDQAYGSLRRTGHSSDTILVGELASTGHLDPGAGLGMQPLRFLRALFCVNARYRQLRGSAAAQRGCPTSPAGSRRFRSQHPGLFNATGWSHHPYHLTTAPDAASPALFPDWVTFADLPKLERALDRLQRAYSSGRRYSIYLTEYGFETDPPRPEFAISPALQATYLNQAEYMAWRDPRVATLSQYLLQDAPPGGGSSVSSFASGLEFVGGAKKPSFAAYRLPVWLPRTRAAPGNSLEVWGCARPAKLYSSRAARRVAIQLDGRTVRSVSTNPRGYFDVTVKFPRSGEVRLAWTPPNGPTVYSRTVAIGEPVTNQGPTFPVAAWLLGLVLILGTAAGIYWRVTRMRRL